MRKKKGGFTLLELVIVVIVIGILASVALPRYIRVVEKSRTGEARQLLAIVKDAQLRYAAQYSAFAASTASLDVNFQPSPLWTMWAVQGANVSNSSEIVGVAERSATQRPVAAYNFTITQGATIACTGDAGSCAAML